MSCAGCSPPPADYMRFVNEASEQVSVRLVRPVPRHGVTFPAGSVLSLPVVEARVLAADGRAQILSSI